MRERMDRMSGLSFGRLYLSAEELRFKETFVSRWLNRHGEWRGARQDILSADVVKRLGTNGPGLKLVIRKRDGGEVIFVGKNMHIALSKVRAWMPENDQSQSDAGAMVSPSSTQGGFRQTMHVLVAALLILLALPPGGFFIGYFVVGKHLIDGLLGAFVGLILYGFILHVILGPLIFALRKKIQRWLSVAVVAPRRSSATLGVAVAVVSLLYLSLSAFRPPRPFLPSLVSGLQVGDAGLEPRTSNLEPVRVPRWSAVAADGVTAP
jgi:hypothetical protein